MAVNTHAGINLARVTEDGISELVSAIEDLLQPCARTCDRVSSSGCSRYDVLAALALLMNAGYRVKNRSVQALILYKCRSTMLQAPMWILSPR